MFYPFVCIYTVKALLVFPYSFICLLNMSLLGLAAFIWLDFFRFGFLKANASHNVIPGIRGSVLILYIYFRDESFTRMFYFILERFHIHHKGS